MSPEEIEKWCAILLEPKRDVYGTRSHAAMQLGSCLMDIKAFNALYSICAYPDVFAIEDQLLKTTGYSIGKILSARDKNQDPKFYHKMDPKYFDGFHPLALEAALSVLTEDQQEKAYQYTLSNLHCAEAMAAYFYNFAVRKAIFLYGRDPYGAMLAASNAIDLFKRVVREEKRLIPHFENIVMHIAAGGPDRIILSLFGGLDKNSTRFTPPQTELEQYECLHINTLAKLVCLDLIHIPPLFTSLHIWIEEKCPRDAEYLKILELIMDKKFSDAYKAAEAINRNQTQFPENEQNPFFFRCWYITVNWLIKKRVF